MAYIFNSPEAERARIGRADSKRPAMTCRGIALSTGKQCRRSVKPPQTFCHTHQEQAARQYSPVSQQRSHVVQRQQGKAHDDRTAKKPSNPFRRLLASIRRHFKKKPYSSQSQPSNLVGSSSSQTLKAALGRREAKQYDSARRTTQRKSRVTHMQEWVPRSLPEKTRQALLAEISKPPSPNDEPGYIYVFFLTDEKRLLPRHHMLLKIGRANNVQRRLTEWHAQCRYKAALSMYYPNPHLPPNSGHRMTRASHRVERLVHLELRERFGYTSSPCSACHKVHREWFLFRYESDTDLHRVLHVIEKWVEFARLRYGEVHV